MADNIKREEWVPTRLRRGPLRNAGARLKKTFETLRLLGARHRSLPHFMIIGTQKGGTSTLYEFLKNHPRIVPATKKEVHYFDLNYEKGEVWYRSHFPRSRQLEGGKQTGEGSPYYLFHPHVPGRIRELVPEIRLIALLRNPVHRAISHYFHVMQRWGDPWEMEKAFHEEEQRISRERTRLEQDPTYTSEVYQRYSYKARGIYVDQIARYLNYFNRNQLLVLSSEQMFSSPEPAYRKVLDFLKLPSINIPAVNPRNIGQYKEEVPESLVQYLRDFFAPHNQRLFELLGEDFGWEG